MIINNCVLDLENSMDVEPAATPWYDLSRYKNHGTITAGAGGWVQLPSGLWVYDFDGIVTKIQHPTFWDTIPTEFTLIAWIYVNSGAGAGYLIGKVNSGGNMFILRHRGAGAVISFDTNGGGIGIIYLSSVGSLPAETWGMATGVYKMGVKSKIYLNTTETEAASVADEIQDGTAFDFTIGARHDNYNTHDGLIALVRIYNYALTPGQVRNYYEKTKYLFGVYE